MQKQEVVEHIRCARCGKRQATKDDQLCDSCHFALTLENIITTKE